MRELNESYAAVALNLHDKGILSNSTLLMEFGIDYKKEQELMKFERDILASLEERSDNPSENNPCGCKNKQEEIQIIEQTRRNIEALTKSYQILISLDPNSSCHTETRNECLELLKDNIASLRKLMATPRTGLRA